MTTRSRLSSSVIDWAAQQPRPASAVLRARHDAAMSRLEVMEFPSARTEAWKYTRLTSLEDASLWVDAPRQDLTEASPAGVSANAGASGPGYRVSRLGDLNEDQQAACLARCPTLPRWSTHPFALLAELQLQHTLVIELMASNEPTPWLLMDEHLRAGVRTQRWLVMAERGSHGRLLHRQHGLPGLGFSTLTLCLADDSRVEHVHWQHAHDNARYMTSTDVCMGRHTYYKHHALTVGSALVRNDLQIDIQGPGAEAHLNGVYVCRHANHVDNHLTLNHLSGQSRSETLYKGLLADQSRGVFNGRIHIVPDAQKTVALLNNRNLMLSAEAEIDTKPELEINADDVKCAHGASIGRIDPMSLFYFEARGIDRARAEAMLSIGFVNEIVDGLPDETLADLIRPSLLAALEGSDAPLNGDCA